MREITKPCFLVMELEMTQARIQDFEMGGGGGGVNFCNNVIEPKPG